MMMIKICGITRVEDAQAAVQAGATALGFVFWPRSPRAVDAETAAAIVQAVPPDILTVGVFVDEAVPVMQATAARVRLGAVQLHGHEQSACATALGCPVWKAFGTEAAASADDWPAHTVILLDAVDPVARGGTGRTVDWTAAAAVARRRPVVLAGGLTPDNVAEAIARVRPYGVDVSSGVERAPGLKDHQKVRRFVEAARAAARQQGLDGDTRETRQ